MKLVFDTSAVICLLERCLLTDELIQLSSSHKLLIPQRVREEFLAGEVSDSDRTNLDRVFELVPVSLVDSLLPYFNFETTDGAIWTISYSLRNQDTRCVIDEEFGRRVCDTVGADFTGSIGVLKIMYNRKILDAEKTKQVKTNLRQSSFFHKGWLLDEIDKVG